MRRFAALAVLAFTPIAAVAQPAPPPAAAAPASDARWSLGAGIQLFTFMTTAPISASIFSPSADIPVVNASLERRLSERTWLAIGVAGAFERRRADVPDGTAGISRVDGRQVFLTTGIRHVVTAPGAPVDVSVVVAAEGGYATVDERFVSFLTPTKEELMAWQVGTNVGIAVDRELTGGLSLRVATPLVGATYQRSRTRLNGEPSRTGNDLSARVLLAPRLELRLAF